MRYVSGIAEVVAGAKLDGLAFRAGKNAAGAEDDVLDRAWRVRAGTVAGARLAASDV